ncbi:hypothetical protein Y032_0343g3058 [Ancylostoma ceylanicum]|uniref:Uncharacterized protein n=1 Tax=Ancylostoma ceylanicum TaxID=53326 RepID=A0A016RXT7_9BILA|nr:hypothetical protein Y032_0343g3058 [Ancylostoma ceylanicum]
MVEKQCAFRSLSFRTLYLGSNIRPIRKFGTIVSRKSLEHDRCYRFIVHSKSRPLRSTNYWSAIVLNGSFVHLVLVQFMQHERRAFHSPILIQTRVEGLPIINVEVQLCQLYSFERILFDYSNQMAVVNSRKIYAIFSIFEA